MTVSITVAIIIACVAIPTAIKATDWISVDNKIEEIEDLTGDFVDSIKEVTVNEDQGVVAQLMKLFDPSKLMSIFDKIIEAFKKPSSNNQEVSAAKIEVSDILSKLEKDASPHLVKISAGTVGTIMELIKSAFAQFQQKANELLAMFKL